MVAYRRSLVQKSPGWLFTWAKLHARGKPKASAAIFTREVENLLNKQDGVEASWADAGQACEKSSWHHCALQSVEPPGRYASMAGPHRCCGTRGGELNPTNSVTVSSNRHCPSQDCCHWISWWTARLPEPRSTRAGPADCLVQADSFIAHNDCLLS